METVTSNTPYFLIAGLVVLVLVGVGYYVLFMRSTTMPNIAPFTDAGEEDFEDEGFEDKKEQEDFENKEEKEGFYGGVARGAGIPDCLRTSADAAKLHSIFAGRADGTEEGPADFTEFTLLLSQLACFKKDLLGVGQQVEATRYQPFATQIDIEPIAETTARCFAKAIPKRDLDIALDKWYKRGQFLITRLCTSANLKEAEVRDAEQTFAALMKDIGAVSHQVCLTGTPIMDAKPLPREPVPHGDSYPEQFREYKGYY
jgi:hypothetical protein